jgi:hypothetical protein
LSIAAAGQRTNDSTVDASRIVSIEKRLANNPDRPEHRPAHTCNQERFLYQPWQFFSCQVACPKGPIQDKHCNLKIDIKNVIIVFAFCKFAHCKQKQQCSYRNSKLRSSIANIPELNPELHHFAHMSH